MGLAASKERKPRGGGPQASTSGTKPYKEASALKMTSRKLQLEEDDDDDMGTSMRQQVAAKAARRHQVEAVAAAKQQQADVEMGTAPKKKRGLKAKAKGKAEDDLEATPVDYVDLYDKSMQPRRRHK